MDLALHLPLTRSLLTELVTHPFHLQRLFLALSLHLHTWLYLGKCLLSPLTPQYSVQESPPLRSFSHLAHDLFLPQTYHTAVWFFGSLWFCFWHSFPPLYSKICFPPIIQVICSLHKLGKIRPNQMSPTPPVFKGQLSLIAN